MMKLTIYTAALTLMMSTPVLAKDDHKDDCTDAKDLVNMAQSIYGAKAELTDIIAPDAILQLKALNGNPAPTGMLYRFEGQTVELPLDENGVVQDLKQSMNFNKDGEICKLIDGVVPEDTGDDTVQANMNFSFAYKPQNGSYSVATLREGAKDGSKIMNSLAPGGLGFVVPGLKSIIIRPADYDMDAMPTVTWTKDGEVIDGPVPSVYAKTQRFLIKDIKRSKADSLKISGPYTLKAGFKFDPEEMAKAEAERVAKLAGGTNSAAE
ncbi:hypothetical protein ACJ3XI_02420 [Litorimonas sp. RW-G-Af-16]|uniref:hypothetical protein n=1 Tax=Litorimonas sp. RW-G-Af-16 TaxID=3241168 RepID=UPI00390CCB66